MAKDNDELFLETHGKKLMEYFMKGKEGEEEKEIIRLIRLYPERRGLLYHMLGALYMLDSRCSFHAPYHKAIEAYENLLNLDNSEEKYAEPALVNLAFAYKAIGNTDKAISYLERHFREYSCIYKDNPELREKITKIYDELLEMKGKKNETDGSEGT